MRRSLFAVMWDVFLFSFIMISSFNHSLILYGITQARGQLKIVFNSREISDVLNDKSVNDTIKSKLILIAEIKKYAIDSLGIKPNDNYTTFFDQRHTPIMWVITAAEPYKMKAYNWQFPFLGKFSYKGFFNKNLAAKEKSRLEQQGYDTDLGTASGWSTLGWLRDPVLSGMLRKPEGQLANLIIHEMTHGTLYVKDSVDFNENLASFIGHHGALLFLKYKFGEGSSQMKKYEDARADEKLFNDYILSEASRLEKFYVASAGDALILKQGKKKRVHEIVDGVSSLALKNKKAYQNIARDALVSGNAFFMSYYRYDSKMDKFEMELKLKYKEKLKTYLLELKKKHPSL